MTWPSFGFGEHTLKLEHELAAQAQAQHWKGEREIGGDNEAQGFKREREVGGTEK